MSVEIKVREKYLHHQVKKVTAPKGSGTTASKKKRHGGPKLVQVQNTTRTRVKVLHAGTGRVSWAWR